MKRRLEHIFILNHRKRIRSMIAFSMMLLFAFSSFVSCTIRADENVAQAEDVRQLEGKSVPEFTAEVDVAT